MGAETLNRLTMLRDVASQLCALDSEHPVRVAVDGVDAAGKTTLADELAIELSSSGREAIRASVDGFHNPLAVRRQRGDSPEGYFLDSFNYEALVRELLGPLGPDGSRRYRRACFDFKTDSEVLSPYEFASPKAILIFDGVFLLRSELRPYWDFSIFVDVPFSVTVPRAVVRDQYLFGDANAVRDRYEARYVPGQRIYIDREQPQLWANTVVDNSDPANPTMNSPADPSLKRAPTLPGYSAGPGSVPDTCR